MENYMKYYRAPRPDDRGRLARFVDYYGFLFLIALITVVLTVTSVPNFVAGLVIAGILIFVEARIYRLVVNKLRQRARLHRRYFLAGENCMNAILELGHGREFNTLVQKILSKQEGFTGLRLLDKGDSGNETDDSGIDLEGLYREEPVAVRCSFFKDPSGETGQAYVKEFVGDLAAKDLDRGIFVTTGQFNRRAYDFAESLKGKYRLHLVDGKGLVELARRAGVDVFPSEERIDRLIQEEKDKTKPDKGMGLKVFYNDAKKAILYFTAAGLLLVVVSLEEWTLFSYVYLVFVALNVVLGVMSIVLGRPKGMLP